MLVPGQGDDGEGDGAESAEVGVVVWVYLFPSTLHSRFSVCLGEVVR